MNISNLLELLRSVYKIEKDHQVLIKQIGVYLNKHSKLNRHYYYLCSYYLSKYNFIADNNFLRELNNDKFIELEPLSSQTWWSNSSLHYNKNIWYQYEKLVKDISKGYCFVCGKHCKTSDIVLNDLWDFDDEKKIQTLIGVYPSCLFCHQINTVTLNQTKEKHEEIKNHLMQVNNWKYTVADEHLKRTLKKKAERDKSEWIVNIDYLINEIKLQPNNFKENEFTHELEESITFNQEYLKDEARSEYGLDLDIKCRLVWF